MTQYYIILMRDRKTPFMPTLAYNRNVRSRVFDESEADEAIEELNTLYNAYGVQYFKIPLPEFTEYTND